MTAPRPRQLKLLTREDLLALPDAPVGERACDMPPTQWELDYLAELEHRFAPRGNRSVWTTDALKDALPNWEEMMKRIIPVSERSAPRRIRKRASPKPRKPTPAPAEDTPDWSGYMPKAVLADLLDCDSRDLLKLHGDKVEFESRQKWRFRLDMVPAVTVRRFEKWQEAERPKKKPRGKSAKSRKHAQT